LAAITYFLPITTFNVYIAYSYFTGPAGEQVQTCIRSGTPPSMWSFHSMKHTEKGQSIFRTRQRHEQGTEHFERCERWSRERKGQSIQELKGERLFRFFLRELKGEL
jgi:hypothetical protein